MIKLIIILLLLYTKSYCSENSIETHPSAYSKDGAKIYTLSGIVLDPQIPQKEVSKLILSPTASVSSQKIDHETQSLQIFAPKTEELILPGNPDLISTEEESVQIESYRLAQNLYEAGLMNLSEFENFSPPLEDPIQPPLLDLEAPNAIGKASTPIDLKSQDRKNTPEKEFFLFSLWENISTTKKLALSLIPDLGYFAFLPTAFITQEPTLIKTILPFSICYGIYFVCTIPFRVKSCIAKLGSPSVSNLIRRIHLRTHTISNFQSQLSQFTRADLRN